MARFTLKLKVGTTQPRFDNAGGIESPLNASTTVVDQAAVEAAVALLEADAALPTQAHVNALRTVWNALVLDIATVPSNADVILSFDATQVVSRNVLKLAVDRLMAMVDGSNDLT